MLYQSARCLFLLAQGGLRLEVGLIMEKKMETTI